MNLVMFDIYLLQFTRRVIFEHLFQLFVYYLMFWLRAGHVFVSLQLITKIYSLFIHSDLILLVNNLQLIKLQMNIPPIQSHKKLSQLRTPNQKNSGSKNLFRKAPTRFNSQPIEESNIQTNPSPHQQRFIPKNIIYDKETLYYEVHELKQALNKVKQDNLRLKSKLRTSEHQKDNLSRSFQQAHSGQKDNYRHSPRNESGRRVDIKYYNLKKQVILLQAQNKKLNQELLYVKKNIKNLQLVQLQLQNKILLEENQRIALKNKELQRQAKLHEEQIIQFTERQKFIKVIIKDNKQYKTQIQNMHIQIMNLESKLKQLRIRQEKQKKIQNIFNYDKKKHLRSHTQLPQTKKDHNMRAITFRDKRSEKIRQTSFKSHYMRVQPLRTQNIQTPKQQRSMTSQKPTQSINEYIQKKIQQVIIEDKIIQTEEQEIEDLCEVCPNTKQSKSHQQILQILEQRQEVIPQINENVDHKKDKDDFIINQRIEQIKQEQKKISKEPEEPIQTILSGSVDNNIAQNEQFQKKSQIVQKKSQILQNKQQILYQQVKQLKLHQIQAKEDSQIKIDKEQQIQQSSVLQPEASTASLKKYQSEKPQPITSISFQESAMPKKYSLINTQSLFSQNINKNLLKQIKILLTYRFKYQKYTFEDLKNDIKNSKTANFNYVDLCYMLVNEPFFFNVQLSKIIIHFIFQKERPSNAQTVTSSVLIHKLRKIVDDFEPLSLSAQRTLAQKCSNIIHQNSIVLSNLMTIAANSSNPPVINLTKMIEILSRCDLTISQIQFLVAETSIHSQDLDHINFGIIFERFSSQSISEVSQKQVIVEQQDEDNSYLGKSNFNKTPKQPEIQNSINDKFAQRKLQQINKLQILEKSPTDQSEIEINKKPKQQSHAFFLPPENQKI